MAARFSCLGDGVDVLSDPMGRSEAAGDGEATNQRDRETGVFDHETRGTHQISDTPVRSVDEEDPLTRHG